MTRSEFAAALGIQPRTAVRLLQEANVPTERVKCGKAERIIVDASQIALRKTQPGKILRAREAARQLGLPVPVLLALRKTGDFQVLHLSPVQPGWHEKDIDAFARKLSSLAQAACESHSETDRSITIVSIMQNRHYSAEIKAALIHALFAQEIPVSGQPGVTIRDIQLDLHRYRKWLAETQREIGGDTHSPTEAAKALRCDRGAIAGLIQLGLLRGNNTPRGLRIEGESINRFSEKYVPLALQAKRLGTSTRTLIRSCRRNEVQMFLAPVRRRGGPQPFIRIADLSKVLPVAV